MIIGLSIFDPKRRIYHVILYKALQILEHRFSGGFNEYDIDIGQRLIEFLQESTAHKKDYKVITGSHIPPETASGPVEILAERLKSIPTYEDLWMEIGRYISGKLNKEEAPYKLGERSDSPPACIDDMRELFGDLLIMEFSSNSRKSFHPFPPFQHPEYRLSNHDPHWVEALTVLFERGTMGDEIVLTVQKEATKIIDFARYEPTAQLVHLFEDWLIERFRSDGEKVVKTWLRQLHTAKLESLSGVGKGRPDKHPSDRWKNMASRQGDQGKRDWSYLKHVEMILDVKIDLATVSP